MPSKYQAGGGGSMGSNFGGRTTAAGGTGGTRSYTVKGGKAVGKTLKDAGKRMAKTEKDLSKKGLLKEQTTVKGKNTQRKLFNQDKKNMNTFSRANEKLGKASTTKRGNVLKKGKK